MSIFSYEWKKIMILQRGLLYMIAALLVSTVWLIATDSPQNSAMEEYRSEYRWYLETLGGAHTGVKFDWLEQEAQAITEARRTRDRLQESYYNGQITAEQYELQIAEVNAVLAHEHGFETLYQQYLYIYENTSNRYFVETNGWAGLFSTQTLDFPLFLVVSLLATAVFCSEYSCQMDTLLRTSTQSRKSAQCKVIITLCAAFILCAGMSLIRFIFFAVKYGLPHGEYPMQSISRFGDSTKNISLTTAYLIVAVLRCFGTVFLAALLLFISVLVKKYALTVVIGAVSTLIPYIGLSKQIYYRLPLPLPFLLATDFLTGTALVKDSLTGEPVIIFSELSQMEVLILLITSAVCCALMVWWVLKQNTNCWQSGKTTVRRCMTAVICLLILISASGCTGQQSEKVVFNSSSQIVSGDYRVAFDNQTRTYVLENRENGRLTELALSPLFGAFSDEEYIKAVYMDSPFIYYLASRTEQYVDRVGSYNSTFTQMSVVQLNMDTFEETVIFEKIPNTGRSLLGIEYTLGDTWMFLQYSHGLFLNDNSLFFITNDGITEVSKVTQQTEKLDIPTNGNIAFDGRTIYFINEDSLLTAYDTTTHTAKSFQDIVASGFCLTEKGLYYINRMDSSRVYLSNRDGADTQKVSNDPAMSIEYNGKEVTMTLKADGKEVILEP